MFHTKDWKIEVQPAHSIGVERVKAFRERPFALHGQQTSKG